MILAIDHGAVRELRLNRPPVNALSPELIVALREAVESAAGHGFRALVLSGTPGRFSGGLDLPLLLGLDRPAMAEVWRNFYALLRALASSPIPIAAAMTGHAPAGGTVLPLFCDWRVMAQGEFKLGLNEVAVAIQLPPVILGALRRQVGPRVAERLAVSSVLISPQEALRIGLVDELVPPAEVIDRALVWCKGLLALPPESMQATRQAARADLVALFEHELEAELQQVTARWWHREAQSTLHTVAEKMGKKK